MRTSQAIEVARTFIRDKQPLLFTGGPGVGKTSILKHAASEENRNLIVSFPAIEDPTDVKGMPFPDITSNIARFLPFGHLAMIANATEPTVWFIDDLGQAPDAVQAGYMQALLARRIGDLEIPDCVSIVAATNRRADRAGVRGLLEPVKGRFVSIVEITPHIDDWLPWARSEGVSLMIQGLLSYRPELLNQFTPTAEMTNSPNPRTWGHADYIVKQQWGCAQARNELIAGAIGIGAATEFENFEKCFHELPDLDYALQNPREVPIPARVSIRFAFAAGLAAYASVKTAASIFALCERFQETGSEDVAALCIKQSLLNDPAILESGAFHQMMGGPLASVYK